MTKNISRQLNIFTNSRWYWLIYIAGGITLLAIALFHQHVLDELPCVMCIHVRLWVTLFVIISLIGLLTRHSRVMNSIVHVSIVVIAAALVERSYQLLGVERGFVTGSCNFDLGLPAWFVVEKWLPWLYRAETTCGYTPEVLFGITMAEGLMILSVGLLLLSLMFTWASFSRIINK